MRWAKLFIVWLLSLASACVSGAKVAVLTELDTAEVRLADAVANGWGKSKHALKVG